MYMDSPVGKLPIRQSTLDKTKEMSKKELFKECDKSRFIDPELLAIIQQKGLYSDFVKYQKN
ncbi:MAG: hypothetical protein ACOCP8_08425 [archaeon]